MNTLQPKAFKNHQQLWICAINLYMRIVDQLPAAVSDITAVTE